MSLTKNNLHDAIDKRRSDADYERFMSEYAELHDLSPEDVFGIGEEQ